MPIRRCSGGRRRPARLSDLRPVDTNLAGGDVLETGNAAQQRRLAATRRAQQAGDAAAGHAETDTSDDGVLVVALVDVGQFE
jgi:hypothetical protein